MQTPTPLLQVDHVTVSFPIGSFLSGSRLVAVNDVSFPRRRTTLKSIAVAGESGSGKTTLSVRAAARPGPNPRPRPL
jgi:ABC-type glutathione transport system ATPase component